jgi:hypothetical protein
MLVQQAVKEVSEGKVSEEQAYRLIGMGLSQREGIRLSIQEEEREGLSFWEKYKCKALKIFCKAIQEGSRLEQALHDVFVYFLGKLGPSVGIGLIYLIPPKGAQALCELLAEECK